MRSKLVLCLLASTVILHGCGTVQDINKRMESTLRSDWEERALSGEVRMGDWNTICSYMDDADAARIMSLAGYYSGLPLPYSTVLEDTDILTDSIDVDTVNDALWQYLYGNSISTAPAWIVTEVTESGEMSYILLCSDYHEPITVCYNNVTDRVISVGPGH